MSRLEFKELLARLSRLRGTVLVCGHAQADMDAQASAQALATLLKARSGCIGTPRWSARHVFDNLRLPAMPPVPNSWEGIDHLVLVDVSNADMLGEVGERLSKFKGTVTAIDHHEHNRKVEAAVYCDAKKSSCSEIIDQIAVAMGKRWGKKEAGVLACGILEDSALLKCADNAALQCLTRLLEESGIELQQAIGWLVHQPDVQERKNALEALQHLHIRQTGNALVAWGPATAFESRLAATLVHTGADLAIVYNDKAGKIAVLKGTHPDLKALNVGAWMETTARRFKISGGGHEAIGGLKTGPHSTREVLQALLWEPSGARKGKRAANWPRPNRAR